MDIESEKIEVIEEGEAVVAQAFLVRWEAAVMMEPEEDLREMVQEEEGLGVVPEEGISLRLPASSVGRWVTTPTIVPIPIDLAIEGD